MRLLLIFLLTFTIAGSFAQTSKFKFDRTVSLQVPSKAETLSPTGVETYRSAGENGTFILMKIQLPEGVLLTDEKNLTAFYQGFTESYGDASKGRTLLGSALTTVDGFRAVRIRFNAVTETSTMLNAEVIAVYLGKGRVYAINYVPNPDGSDNSELEEVLSSVKVRLPQGQLDK